MSEQNNHDYCNARIYELEEALGKMSKMLDKAFSEPMRLGIVEAYDPEEQVYRVEEEGKTSFLYLHSDPEQHKDKQEQKEITLLEKNTLVLCTGNFIKKTLPDSLKVKPSMPEFKFVKWSEIGGIKSQVSEIRDSVELPLKHKELYESYGIEPMKGMMLYGPPGCGKTLIAKAIATFVMKSLPEPDEDSFIYIKGPEVLNHFVGSSERNIRSLFHRAREHYSRHKVRSVLFIDEAESLMGMRGRGISSDMDKTIVPTFLAEMDGFSEHSPFIILATNRPDNMDSAIIRPGRIDKSIEIRRPDKEDSIEIFNIHLSKTKLHEEVSLEEASKMCAEELYDFCEMTGAGISGAMIATIVKEAAEKSVKSVIENGTAPGITIQELYDSISVHAKPAVTINFNNSLKSVSYGLG